VRGPDTARSALCRGHCNGAAAPDLQRDEASTGPADARPPLRPEQRATRRRPASAARGAGSTGLGSARRGGSRGAVARLCSSRRGGGHPLCAARARPTSVAARPGLGSGAAAHLLLQRAARCEDGAAPAPGGLPLAARRLMGGNPNCHPLKEAARPLFRPACLPMSSAQLAIF
jgi:hypothetical protein